MIRRTIWRLVGLLVLSLACLAAPTLAPADDLSPVRIAVLGDRTGGHQPGIYEQIVEEIARLRPDFVMTVGDMVEGYTDDSTELEDQWEEYRYLISPLTAPIHFTPGNHELFSEMGEKAYREHVGLTYYSFNFDRVHIIVLDNSRYDYPGQMPTEQLDWLEKDLKSYRNAYYTLVFMHKPFWYETIVHNTPDTLHALFRQYGVDAVFSGHFHEYFSVDYQGIKYTSLGSSGGEMDVDFGSVGYHFLYVTLDYRGIFIAPIKIGSVQSWDINTIVDHKVYENLRNRGLTFDRPIPLSSDKAVPRTAVRYTVDNSLGNYPIQDTLVWKSAPGWHFSPRTQFVMVPPHESRTYTVSVSANNATFPPPTAELSVRYSKDNSLTVREPIPLARTAACVHADTAPIVDGFLSESIWRKPETSYYDPSGAQSQVEPTEVYFAYDNINLYIAARCRESHPDLMQVRADHRDDAVSLEDCIGFFIAPNTDVVRTYQIYFNPEGVAFDQRFERDTDGYMHGDVSWNGDYSVQTQRFEDGWTLEAAIPLSTFDTRLVQGDTWRVNFRRKQARLTRSADWQTPIEYDPKSFGLLIAR